MMRKIPTLFERDEEARGRLVIDKVKDECAWVLAGEGIATRKFDGQNVKIVRGDLYKRYYARMTSGGSYVRASAQDPSDRYIIEAFAALLEWSNTLNPRPDIGGLDGIYEAVGPKIQGNSERFGAHMLIQVVPPGPETVLWEESIPGGIKRTFDGLRVYLKSHDIEGIVFHHDDGRMAKIKKRDYGLRRG